MTVLRIVDLKERIAISDDFSLQERKFLLRCIDLAITRQGEARFSVTQSSTKPSLRSSPL
jgi:hypothetical protein